MKEIHPLDVKKMISSGEPFTLIDVREDSEWNKSRVAGSVHHLSKVFLYILICQKNQELFIHFIFFSLSLTNYFFIY